MSTAHYSTEPGAGLERRNAPDSYKVAAVPSSLAYYFEEYTKSVSTAQKFGEPGEGLEGRTALHSYKVAAVPSRLAYYFKYTQRL